MHHISPCLTVLCVAVGCTLFPFSQLAAQELRPPPGQRVSKEKKSSPKQAPAAPQGSLAAALSAYQSKRYADSAVQLVQLIESGKALPADTQKAQFYLGMSFLCS